MPSTCGKDSVLTLDYKCKKCLPGEYKLRDDDVQFECLKCQPGYTSNADNTGCVICPNGQTSKLGSICEPCALGYSGSNGMCYFKYTPYGCTDSPTIGPCTNCAKGSTAYGDGVCIPCPAGSITTSSSPFGCNFCGPGTYPQKGSSNCLSCPAGFYSPGALQNCLKCPTGYISSNSSYTCIECQSGSYSNQNGSECLKCPTNTYSVPGSSSCTPCSSSVAACDLQIEKVSSQQSIQVGAISGGILAAIICGSLFIVIVIIIVIFLLNKRKIT